MARAARAINAPLSLEETSDTIAKTARLALPGFDAVGISMMDKDGKVHTRAATGKLVWSWTVFSTSSVKGLVSIRFGTLTL
jgi:hypothetical protein